MNTINKLGLTALLSLVPLSMGSCDVAGTSPNDIVAETAIEKEDARLDELINSYTGSLADFPVDYNKELLLSIGEQSISDFAYDLQRPGMISAMPFADDVMDTYKYGDSIYIVTDHFEDAEYVARALEFIKRKLPNDYAHVLEDISGVDYTVFSFHDVETSYGDWYNASMGRSAQYDTTGGNVSFIIGDRSEIIAENDNGESVETVGLSSDEKYDLIMKEVFPAVALHENLHALYRRILPSILDPENTGFINKVVEHLNIYNIQSGYADDLGASDHYVNVLLTGSNNLANYCISNNLLETTEVEPVKNYRAF
ncbi:MAG: hypothetical protein JEZ08_25155 [Clostridiales bacterium]|nr:hypothetical protein [Clostridiales bacterium]